MSNEDINKEYLIRESVRVEDQRALLGIVPNSSTDELAKESRMQLEAELAYTTLLQSISMELILEDNIQALYERIIEAAMKIMHSEYASMQMIHNEEGKGNKLQLLAFRGFSPEAAKFWEWVYAEDSGSTCGEALRTGQRAIAVNVEECGFMKDTEDLEVFLQTGIHAVQTTPLYSRSGNMIGMISTHWCKPHQPLESELRYLDLLARQAADLIEQIKSKEKLRESEEKYRNLFEHMNEGFFLGEIICDESGKPIDFLYLTVNSAMDRVIKLRNEEIINKKASEICNVLNKWINIFGEVAVTGKSIIFEDFSEYLERYLLIKAFCPKLGQFACVIQDITESRKLERELRYQKELFESVVENMHDALAIYDKEGKIEFINAEARNLYKHLHFGTTVENINDGFQFFDFKKNVILEENLPVRRVLKGEKIRNERMIIKCADRKQYTEINATPIFDDKNSLKSAVVSHHDISDIIEHEQELKRRQEKIIRSEQEKRETIEAAMKLKDEFIYLITHEFKTPIAVISSVLQTIESFLKADVSERLGRYLNMIKMNTNRQLRLVNNLLDITRLNSGHIKLNKRCADIVYITNSIVNSVEEYARLKQINLSFTSDLVKKDIYIDEEKFERIMLNLLSNALKFTPNGKDIYVLLSTKRHKNKNFISISVKDEGIGIPEDKQRVVFDRFGQADTSLSRQAEGTGLGLHLVNLLVNALDGEILLKSEPGIGSTFTVLLPAVKSKSLDKEEFNQLNNQLISKDERIIQSASIEFSDIYFD